MSELDQVNAVETRLRAIYGRVDWSEATGVLQVAAISQAKWQAIIPGPPMPPSPTDRFVLGAARARADAIVTSGAVLRKEPDLVHDPGGDARSNAAFRAWREAMIGGRAAPLLVVLSASGHFPLDHPAFEAGREGFVITTKAGASVLPDRVGRLDVVVADPAPSPVAAALGLLAAEAKPRAVLIEAGPTASAPLYGTDARTGKAPRCNELLLSRYQGAVASAALGPAFVSKAEIEACFPVDTAFRSETPVRDASGDWYFDRYRVVC